jgi:hypothetical protein
MFMFAFVEKINNLSFFLSFFCLVGYQNVGALLHHRATELLVFRIPESTGYRKYRILDNDLFSIVSLV